MNTVKKIHQYVIKSYTSARLTCVNNTGRSGSGAAAYVSGCDGSVGSTTLIIDVALIHHDCI